ncbi:MAG: hypothetical protein D6737_06595 [Chloroflexi bacterium]|nr:MAG: hypothetical protein CUN54_08015 [Phototrophicales bacterium]RMF80905.1 MAG: hypothetical protein D6737_06595 [Chloroflexota bacterium]
MPAIVKKLPDQPIVIVSIQNYITVDDARAVYQQLAKIAADIDGTVYRITDVCQMTMTFQEMIAIVREAMRGAPGSTSDPRIKNIFVGQNCLAEVAQDLMAKQGVDILMFDTMQEAMDYIQQQIDESQYRE